jgi:hypothetical protein
MWCFTNKSPSKMPIGVLLLTAEENPMAVDTFGRPQKPLEVQPTREKAQGEDQVGEQGRRLKEERRTVDEATRGEAEQLRFYDTHCLAAQSVSAKMMILKMTIQFGAPRRLESLAKPIYGFFNRKYHLLEPLVNHGKQTPAHRSNRNFMRASQLFFGWNAHRKIATSPPGHRHIDGACTKGIYDR